MMSEPIKRMTRAESHFKVIDIFKMLPKGSILDIPAGQGALAVDLQDIGFKVTCGDIDPKHFQAQGIENVRIDLNARLPFADESFDYIACVAGLHRVWNLNMPISEFRRILKPNGYLIVSIPNYSNISSRIKFMLRGSISRSVNIQSFDQHTDEQSSLFRSNLFYPQLKTLMVKNGFNILDLYRDKAKKSALIYLPLIMLVKLLGIFSSAKTIRESCLSEMSSGSVLSGGNNIIIVCRKK
jgi:SAM-dependent methyltransferase